jgi:tetratricopeptide (TPR) repeat protein
MPNDSEFIAPPPAEGAERAELDEAARLAQSGRPEEAQSKLSALVARNPRLIEAHSLRGAVAFHQMQFADAKSAFEACVGLHPGLIPVRLNLAACQERLGERDEAANSYLAAWKIDPGNSRLAQFAGAALEAAGREDEAATLFSLADDLDPSTRTAKDDPRASPDLRQLSATADRVMRRHFTRLHAQAVDHAERTLKAKHPKSKIDLSRVRAAVWTQTHEGPVEFRTPQQEPSIFYMPDLPARPITPREELPWASLIEAATAEIREEYLAAVQGGAEFSPYVAAREAKPGWELLSGQLDWSSLHLFKAAQETGLTRFFPKTLKALEAADVVRVEGGKAVEMFFSRLKPGAHIPPHFGCANNRLTVHLPLIVPGDCAIRVGSATHAWREGELFAFDDSFEHEAWNRSQSDRVVLIFESHHPDLRADERFAVEQAYETRGVWVRDRRARALGQGRS